MHRSDYIPRSDGNFLTWIIHFLKNLGGRLTQFNFPKDVYDRLEEEKNTFAQMLELVSGSVTRTSVVVKDKNAARKRLEKDTRNVVGEYLNRNHLLSDGDREMLGLPIRKTTRTPAPMAETYPDFDIDTRLLSHLIIHFFEKDGDHKRSKPAGQHGAEINWIISDVPMVDANEFTHSSFDTRTPFTLEFSGHDRGKTVYLALRWENTRGQKGPWSPIQKAIIP
jgi:hypothetical protein